ncbi:hypothetical protein K505DRAFT_220209, partial [Melanomma pulvis-pyrius CBS 109.77]
LSHFQQELDEAGCLNVRDLPAPTLTNAISPIFDFDRWVVGYDQGTGRLWDNLKPALKAATLMLTESCMLPWFIHLTCGHLTLDSMSSQIYLASCRDEHVPGGREDTLRNLHELGKVITIMFVPHNYQASVYGVTYRRRESVKWASEYYASDFPPIPDRYRGNNRARPCIAMASGFQEFFLHGFQAAPPAQRYRMSFLFVETLLHEVAHAYWYHLDRSNMEPLWSRHEKKAELGYSWETMTFGRISNPIGGDVKNCQVLLSFREEKYSGERDRQRALRTVLGRDGSKMNFTRVSHFQGQFNWVTNPEVRGYNWFGSSSSDHDQNTVAVVHAIPMRWIVQWFSEAAWNIKRAAWRDDRTYSPPSLGQTFLLLYQEQDGIASLHIPDNPRIDADPYLQTVRSQAEYMHLYD